MSWTLLLLGALAALASLNTHFPPRRPGELAALAFGPAWWGGELPLHWAALSGGMGVALITLGGLEGVGWAGLALLILSGLGPLASWRQATRVRERLIAEGLMSAPPQVPWVRWLIPFWFADRDIQVECLVRDGERLRADVYRPRAGVRGAPLLVYIHGGGWVFGFRRWQGRLLIRRLVRAGWVCVSVQYRLSPWATWPDHIIDVKRAVAWARRTAANWGADPTRVAVSGNSAGGHLAALAALTPNRPDLQPGFEGEDTGIAALVGWYGVYDLLDAARAWPHGALRRLWELLVIKQRISAARDLYTSASPISHVSAESPPTLLIHGTLDTLVPIGSARAMQARFDELAPGRSRLVEIEGAEHAFEVLWSRRGVYAVEVAATWLERTLGASDAERAAHRVDEQPGKVSLRPVAGPTLARRPPQAGAAM